MGRLAGLLHPFALGLTLLLPWLLLHARAGAEIAIDLIALVFLVRCAAERDWQWLRQGWVPLGLAWWAWLVACTALNLALPGEGTAELAQSVMLGRFLLLVAALERWVLQDARSRRWLLISLTAATLYVAAQTMLQFATGHNLFGNPRSADGELTGPFDKPRDAPTFVRMLFPVLLPLAGGLLGRKGWLPLAAGAGLIVAAMAVTVLIGQRMPVLLAFFGLVVTGLLLRRLRGPVIIGAAAAASLIAASVVISPPAFYRLVTKFSAQMETLPSSPYGLLAERSVAIVGQHPVTGRGYDGYRTGCPDPRYYQGWHWPGDAAPIDPTGDKLCLTHPHNLYLQAATDAGLPGLALFATLAVVWLWRLGRGLVRQPDPLRTGLFVAALIQLWPIASTSPLVSLPIGAWFFLLLGFGLAEAPMTAPSPGLRGRGSSHG